MIISKKSTAKFITAVLNATNLSKQWNLDENISKMLKTERDAFIVWTTWKLFSRRIIVRRSPKTNSWHRTNMWSWFCLNLIFRLCHSLTSTPTSKVMSIFLHLKNLDYDNKNYFWWFQTNFCKSNLKGLHGVFLSDVQVCLQALTSFTKIIISLHAVRAILETHVESAGLIIRLDYPAKCPKIYITRIWGSFLMTWMRDST